MPLATGGGEITGPGASGPPAAAEELSALVDSELSEIVTSRQMPLYQMMSYHLGWTGPDGTQTSSLPIERVRGVLCLRACLAVGGSAELAAPAAAAVELVHNFCQIHDDVEGGSPQRDGRDSVWWVWGPAQAINAGDGMHALARLALASLSKHGVSPKTTFDAVRVLDEASLRTCEGKFLALEATERLSVSVDSCLDVVARSSGALVACATKLGALIATDDDALVDALATCGEKIGLAMGVRAEIRELWGDGSGEDAPSPEVMNKKKLLPVAYALEKASAGERRRIGEIYFKRVLEPDDVVKLRDIVDGLGAREWCEELVERCRGEAASALEAPGVTAESRDEIERYVERLLG